MPRGKPDPIKQRVRCRLQNWEAVTNEILSAGFSVSELAERIRSSPPTVRAMARGFYEPRYSQGTYLLAMRRLVALGRLKPRESK